MAMESLPFKIQNFMVRQCAKEDIMNLRLVSKAFHNHATHRLFSTLHMKNTDGSIQYYQNILSSPHLAKALRQITFITVEDPEEEHDRDCEAAELSEEFSKALESSCNFPNRNAVGIHFSKHCGADDPSRWYIEQAHESFNYRSDVFKAFKFGPNNPEYPTPNVRSLSINNLQYVKRPRNHLIR
jgi:hypothetical protein